jgi:hypothetical protein
MGCVSLGLAPVAGLTGILTALLMHCRKPTVKQLWKGEDGSRTAAFWHRWSSYITLLVANLTVMSGVINYVLKQIKQDKYLPAVGFTMPLFLAIVIYFEVKLRSSSEPNFGLEPPQNTMTVAQFESEVD